MENIDLDELEMGVRRWNRKVLERRRGVRVFIEVEVERDKEREIGKSTREGDGKVGDRKRGALGCWRGRFVVVSSSLWWRLALDGMSKGLLTAQSSTLD